MDFGGLHYSTGQSDASIRFMVAGVAVCMLSLVLAARFKQVQKPLLVVAAGGAAVGAMGGVWMGASHVYRRAQFLTGDRSVLTSSIPANYNGFVFNPLGVQVTRQVA